MKKLSLIICIVLFISPIHSQVQIKVTEVSSVRFYKPYETIYKNLYAMRNNPYRANDTVIFSKLMFGGLNFDAIYQFKDDKLTDILLKRHFNGDEFIHISSFMKTNYGRQSDKKITNSGLDIYWYLENTKIILTLNRTDELYSIFFVTTK